jgi:hypothetical protein
MEQRPQAPHDHRRRLRARTRRLLLGGRHPHLKSDHHARSGGAAGRPLRARASVTHLWAAEPLGAVTPVSRRRGSEDETGPAVPNPRIPG